MRGAFVAMVAVALPGAAMAAPTKSQASERAYTLSLMCSAVAANDGEQADYSRTFDAVRKTGRKLGHSEARISQDVLTMAQVVGDRAHRDPSSLDGNREICRKLGLIG